MPRSMKNCSPVSGSDFGGSDFGLRCAFAFGHVAKWLVPSGLTGIRFPRPVTIQKIAALHERHAFSGVLGGMGKRSATRAVACGVQPKSSGLLGAGSSLGMGDLCHTITMVFVFVNAR